MLIQVANFYAQKGGSKQPCVDDRAIQEVCIAIDTNDYRGYYQLRDSDYNPIPGLNTFYKDSDSFKLKAGKYRLIIGDSVNSILFELYETGNITTDNSVALDTTVSKKIKFNTVQIKINPDKFDGLYYFSIFRPDDLFQSSQNKGYLCPYTKNMTNIPQRIENDIIKVCPRYRIPANPIYLVPSLRYWIETNGVGYSAFYFTVEEKSPGSNLGKITSVSSPQSAKLEKDGMRFLTKRIKISTTNYSGNFRLGQNLYEWKQISPTNPMYFEVVLNSNTFFGLDGGNNNQPIIVYQSSSGVLNVIPQTAFFEIPSQKQTNGQNVFQFKFCMVGVMTNGILCE